MTQTRCRGLQQIPGGHSRATCRTVHEAYISTAHIVCTRPQGRGHTASCWVQGLRWSYVEGRHPHHYADAPDSWLRGAEVCLVEAPA